MSKDPFVVFERLTALVNAIPALRDWKFEEREIPGDKIQRLWIGPGEHIELIYCDDRKNAP